MAEPAAQAPGIPADLPSWQKSIPTIHNLEHSQALRVVWALEELAAAKGLKYNIKNYPRVRPKNPDLMKLSPVGKSPILTVESLNGKPLPNIQIKDGVMMETRLILNFLSKEYGGKDLWATESEEDRRRDEYFQEYASASFTERVDFVLLFEVIPSALPFPLKQLASLMMSPIVKVMLGFLEDYLIFQESQLTDETPWFAGKKLGLSDFGMSFAMDVATQRGYIDKKKYPKLVKWHESIVSRDAYKKAIEKVGGMEKYNLISFGI